MELLDSIVDANTPAAVAKGLVLRGQFAGEAGLVESDQHRLRQIVTNLVTNAIKYTDSGSSMCVLNARSNGLISRSLIPAPGLRANSCR